MYGFDSVVVSPAKMEEPKPLDPVWTGIPDEYILGPEKAFCIPSK
jgi:hypothetical protein